MDKKNDLFQAPPEISKWFQNLTDKQLVEFFYQVVQGRSISGEGKDYCQEHLVLANASRVRDYIDPESEELSPWEPWQLQLLALYDRSQYSPQGWIDNAPICQIGNCTAINMILSAMPNTQFVRYAAHRSMAHNIMIRTDQRYFKLAYRCLLRIPLE